MHILTEDDGRRSGQRVSMENTWPGDVVRARSIGEMLDAGVALVVRAAVPLLAIGCVLIMIPYVVQSIAIDHLGSGQYVTKNIFVIVTFFADILARGAFVLILTEATSPMAAMPTVVPTLLRTAVRLVALSIFVAAIMLVVLGVLAIPLIAFFATGVHAAGRTQEFVVLTLLAGPGIIAFLTFTPFVLMAEIFAAFSIVRDGKKPRESLVTALRLMFAKTQRRRSILMAILAFVPTFALYVVKAVLHTRLPSIRSEFFSLLYGLALVATSAFEIAVAITYRRDLQIRVEGYDLHTAAAKLGGTAAAIIAP